MTRWDTRKATARFRSEGFATAQDTIAPSAPYTTGDDHGTLFRLLWIKRSQETPPWQRKRLLQTTKRHGRPVRRRYGLLRVRQFRQTASRRFRLRLVKLQQTAPCGLRHPLPRAAGACTGRSADYFGEQRFDLPELPRRRPGRSKILPRVRHEARRRVLRPVRCHVAPDRQILPRMRSAARLARSLLRTERIEHSHDFPSRHLGVYPASPHARRANVRRMAARLVPRCRVLWSQLPWQQFPWRLCSLEAATPECPPRQCRARGRCLSGKRPQRVLQRQ